jgi:hypothetical protein
MPIMILHGPLEIYNFNNEAYVLFMFHGKYKKITSSHRCPLRPLGFYWKSHKLPLMFWKL